MRFSLEICDFLQQRANGYRKDFYNEVFVSILLRYYLYIF